MVKTRITDAGIISEPGDGFEGAPTSVGAQTKTADFTLTRGDVGLLIMSAAQGVVTGTMPSVASCPGAMFIMRSTSPSAHVLTSSAGDGNAFSERFSNASVNLTGSHGSKLVMPAAVGSSVVMVSDGLNWAIIGGSGSISLVAQAV